MPVYKFWMGSITSFPDSMYVTTLDKIWICGKRVNYTLNIRQSLPGVSDHETWLDRLPKQIECLKNLIVSWFFFKLSFKLTNFGFIFSKRPLLTAWIRSISTAPVRIHDAMNIARSFAPTERWNGTNVVEVWNERSWSVDVRSLVPVRNSRTSTILYTCTVSKLQILPEQLTQW